MVSQYWDQLVTQLQNESALTSRSLRTHDQAINNNYIDIDRFIKVIYSLFDINNLLLNSKQVDNVNADININVHTYPNKFLFTSEYLDDKSSDRDIITYEILRKKPASLAANAQPFEGTRQWRPMLRGIEKNKITGVLEIHQQVLTDNLVRFTAYSTSVEQAHKLANFLENFFAKYHWFLRQFVPVICLEGRTSDSRISGGHGPLRYYPIYIDFFIRTAEIYKLSENELKEIEVQINKVKTIISDFL